MRKCFRKEATSSSHEKSSVPLNCWWMNKQLWLRQSESSRGLHPWFLRSIIVILENFASSALHLAHVINSTWHKVEASKVTLHGTHEIPSALCLYRTGILAVCNMSLAFLNGQTVKSICSLYKINYEKRCRTSGWRELHCPYGRWRHLNANNEKCM